MPCLCQCSRFQLCTGSTWLLWDCKMMPNPFLIPPLWAAAWVLKFGNWTLQNSISTLTFHHDSVITSFHIFFGGGGAWSDTCLPFQHLTLSVGHCRSGCSQTELLRGQRLVGRFFFCGGQLSQLSHNLSLYTGCREWCRALVGSAWLSISPKQLQ